MNWFMRNWENVIVALWQHIAISGSALLISLVVAFPLGVVAARHPKTRGIILGVTSTLYTIPTMALLALLIPIVGLGRTNAIIAMVMFSLLVLTRNITAGIQGAAPDIVDAARGTGMTPWQVLVQVELPLAMPAIVAGLRVAAVTVISVTVVAAYVNAGGLGTLIFEGMASDHAPKIWVGALTACALSVIVDVSLARAETFFGRRAL